VSVREMSAWFLGPKAENAAWERQMLTHILEDYFHWRRNYFPGDEILVTESMRREQVDFHDRLAQQVDEMLAGLRAHFPFYSPRYNAHMLSDQTIPAVLGYFAGLLYNPNNVTPESAPVTLKWELELGADILKMLGYAPPPPEGVATKEEFGWAHVTGGGTVANLEALWLAREVRYFPLAVRDVCRKHNIALTLKLPKDPETAHDIAALAPEECLTIRPNQAIYLFGRLIDAVRRQSDLTHPDSIRTVHEWLAESEFSLGNHGTRAAFGVRPPVLLVSDAFHYSIPKAADVLGIGRENVIPVDVDAHFRMDVHALEDALRRTVREGKLPLAVVAIAGTTEVGAVDPVDRIAALREEMTPALGESFWLHVDAAWGGYFRSLFVDGSGDARTAGAVDAADAGAADTEAADALGRRGAEGVAEFVSRDLMLDRGRYSKHLHLKWGSPEVLAAFEAFPKAESIIVDPHKMGYVPYPCGVVAFRNDLVRQFSAEEIAYISSTQLEDVDTHRHRGPDTIGPYILEGSKPGANVAACWLSHRMIPPERRGYGQIMRASLLGARELYERLVHWDTAERTNGVTHAWRFVPVTSQPADTNILCFLIQERPARGLEFTNRINQRVYEAFTIGARPGAPAYSYSQPFFLSRTVFQPSHYPSAAIRALLGRAEIQPADYREHGLFLLRATVMSPYHVLAAETGHKQALLAEFVEQLAREADEAVAAQ
jgi:tyrosine decarboxylase